jgi:hypothetical protein
MSQHFFGLRQTEIIFKLENGGKSMRSINDFIDFYIDQGYETGVAVEKAHEQMEQLQSIEADLQMESMRGN